MGHCVPNAFGVLVSGLSWVILVGTVGYVYKFVFQTWLLNLPGGPGIIARAFLAVYLAVAVLALVCHARAATTDPGWVSKQQPRTRKDTDRLCDKCGGSWKPPRAHHCRVCRRCVFRMDHHCFWINNCVGFYNQKFFILFLLYTSLMAGATLALLSMGGFLAWRAMRNGQALQPSITAAVGGVVVSALAVFFTVFVSGFLSDQVEAIESNTTNVETYQHTRGAELSFDEHMKIVFGSRRVFWPLPVLTDADPNLHEPVESIFSNPKPVDLAKSETEPETPGRAPRARRKKSYS